MFHFKHLFSAPSYLRLPAFGLDISDNSLKYIKLKEMRSGYRLQDFGEAKIPTGIIESGSIKKQNDFVNILKETFGSKKHLRHVSLSLPEEKGFLRIIRLPKMSIPEINEAIPFQLEENVPLSAEEAAFDYEILPTTNPKADFLDILIVAFPKIIIDSYLDAIEEAGLTPISLEMEAQAMARAIISPEDLQKTILVADIGLTRTGLFIVDHGLVEFTSTVPIGGRHINKALMEAFSVPLEEAEKIKITHGLSQTPEGKKIALALASIVNAIKEEAARRIDFWQAHAPAVIAGGKATPIEKMYLCGGDANLTGLSSYLSYELKIPVSLANVWVNVVQDSKYVPEIEFNKSLAYTTTIGLALGAVRGETGQT
ncbi:MAG: hypothetical protein A2756_05560 [Candidatus Ryanbacteria bacterium RIFCSPHIGHO2_01_FULL_48_27]|uniref:SHS2 domain-containing protein n=1 Tax=Candidatus Ryanbacteria bacterium RIFCSPHIGHO2_01_FULL_48_27 TaxID=1802115 RepID=A0A1G2G304_9BACT|nr:MAG: hypothetical protein A2756_05560 [Candidatus Ryanbacteria bacterium RIFCSPHIGHO2_01_FULL_48_27]